MDLRQLRYFVAVAEELHFTRAAARLHLAQSALSAQIRSLEREVGAELFTRTSRRVTLTPVGDALLVDARQLLAVADATLGRARLLARSKQRRLIVGCLGPATAELLTPVISEFAARHPDVSVDVLAFDFAELLPCLRDGRADVAFAYFPHSKDELADLTVVPLAEEPRIVALAESHPLARRDSLEPADLADEVFVTRAGVSEVWRDFWLLTDQLDGRRPQLCPRQAVSRDEWLYLIASGHGIDTAPQFVARRYHWPGIAYVPLVNVPPAQQAMVRSSMDSSDLPAAFMDVARSRRRDIGRLAAAEAGIS
ncbi:LysR substrate-binding domain-containing protein [Conexibacter stalactiti]|uniref:LysR substrate-binding domain-containing protein n=1 Tax=Conexibacter stalactiti TaxID=1940611 RepID=A0ABU4HSK4_9ACTN|nr:LysR substrate-binding domain-containing protein [Conexibacter stalactiti]MDW5596276.1 LysR substrate-binding domain-containing protein [Conexibacter stalactiti]MEC5036918.1 LysR substrate-binding domain-containing protein [Conexibacter stalactiti]